MNNKPKSSKRLGLAELTLIGLAAGIFCGLFFGEEASRLNIIGDIYIRLLQMTVLPYIFFSLIANIGQLTVEQAKLLAKRAGTVLLILWGIGIVMVITMPLALPPQVSASFFSSSIFATPEKIDLVSLFIPSNIFGALAENIVPSIVFFSIFSGIALIGIGIPQKESIIKLFEALVQTMTRATQILAAVAPIGVFAITADAAGTIELSELGRLQGYIIIYVIAFLLLAFWVLPGLVAALTPFKFGEVIKISRTPLIIAFSTGNALVVLPLIIEGVKELFKKYNILSQEAINMTQVVVPLAYPFPTLGKMLAMLFVPFAAWYVGESMSIADYGVYIAAGFPSFFGSVTVAIPFALDLIKIPGDMFQLFLATSILATNIGDCLTAMHIMALSLLVACASSGSLRLRWQRLGIVLVTTVLVTGILLFGTRVYLAKTSEGSYNKDEIVASLQLIGDPVPHVIVEPAPNPEPLLPGETMTERVRRRDILRVGFNPDNLPWSFYNAQKQLVGFDIDMAFNFAKDSGINQIEFVPFQDSSLVQQMNEDHFDIAMSGIVGTVERSIELQLTQPYLYINLALVVPDYKVNQFSTLESIQVTKNLRIGVVDTEVLTRKVESLLPNVEFVVLESDRDFFEDTEKGKNLDALLISAEEGSAWTLLYPNFQVVTPFPRQIALPLVYPFQENDQKADEIFDHWIELRKNDGTIQVGYDYWILGKGTEQKQPRWSIIRNVLHWID